MIRPLVAILTLCLGFSPALRASTPPASTSQQQQIEQLQAENAALKAENRTLRMQFTETPPGTAAKAPPASPNAPVDINRAGNAELESLPGIGPVAAQRIVDGRPYASVEDLLKVKGIGAKTLDRLRPLVTTGTDSGSSP